MANYIFFDGRLEKRAGGPSTYLYNLKNGLTQIDEGKINFIYNTTEKNIGTEKKITVWAKNVLKKFPKIYERILMKKRMKKNELYNRLKDVVKSGDIVMFHMTSDLAKALEFLPEDCTKILMSHSPEVAAKQMSTELCSKFNCKKYKFSYTEKEYFEKFDMVAFKNADVIVFPSKESMEPYYQTIQNFDEIILNKDVKYLPTGTEELQFEFTREEFREKYQIPQNSFVITFIGRHNEVKGYDNFVEICSQLINKYKDIFIITAGIGEIPSLKHERWIDVGWTNDPGSIANAADLFVLSNRRTYFDLILLEMLSIGKTCLVSNTGGNKTMSMYSSGIITYNEIDDAVLKIEELYNNRNKLLQYESENLKTYKNCFNTNVFAKKYIDLMKDIEENKDEKKHN